MNPHWLVDGPKEAKLTIVLAHGAGVPMDSPFMETSALGLADFGLRVVRFEFPYMRRRRTEAKKPGPDRFEVLAQTWQEVVGELGDPGRVVVGGKSMGGRIASMLADEMAVAGVVCLGYPFHPSGRPEQLRIEHLRDLRTPCLIAQGERDSMGTRDEVGSYPLSAQVRLHWLVDGDHSFKPRRRSGLSSEQNMASAIAAAGQFVVDLQRELDL